MMGVLCVNVFFKDLSMRMFVFLFIMNLFWFVFYGFEVVVGLSLRVFNVFVAEKFVISMGMIVVLFVLVSIKFVFLF